MRNILDVIDQIINVLPSNTQATIDPDDMRTRLIWLKEDFAFKAPEQLWECWVRLAEYLQESLGEPQNCWQACVSRIMRGAM